MGVKNENVKICSVLYSCLLSGRPSLSLSLLSHIVHWQLETYFEHILPLLLPLGQADMFFNGK